MGNRFKNKDKQVIFVAILLGLFQLIYNYFVAKSSFTFQLGVISFTEGVTTFILALFLLTFISKEFASNMNKHSIVFSLGFAIFYSLLNLLVYNQVTTLLILGIAKAMMTFIAIKIVYYLYK